MTLMAKEDARQCLRCGYKWWAVRAPKPPKLHWYDDTDLISLTGISGRYVKKSKREEAGQAWARWGICSRCGSQTIRSVPSRGFVPTASEEAAHASRLQAGSQNGPQVGSRVKINQFLYRGQTGTITKLGKTDCTIELDNGKGKARFIELAKIELI